MRVIIKSSYDTSSRFLLNSHGWDNLSVRGAKQKANLMYKCIIIISTVGHLFKNYDTIYVRFSPRTLAIIPATRYTCVYLRRILAFFPALWVFIPKYMAIFLQTRIYMRTKKLIYSPRVFKPDNIHSCSFFK